MNTISKFADCLRSLCGIERRTTGHGASLPNDVEVDPKTPLGVLHRSLRGHLTRLGEGQRRHQSMTVNVTLLTVALTSFSAVLLGLEGDLVLGTELRKNFALVFSATVAIANAYEALFKPHRLWVREGRTYGLLKDILLKVELQAAMTEGGKTARPDVVEGLRQALEKRLQEDLNAWVRQHGEELLAAQEDRPTPTPTTTPTATTTSPDSKS